MARCCQPGGYDKVFNPRFARHTAARYRSRGLDRTARRMVDWLVGEGIEGASILEIGGGVGAIHSTCSPEELSGQPISSSATPMRPMPPA